MTSLLQLWWQFCLTDETNSLSWFLGKRINIHIFILYLRKSEITIEIHLIFCTLKTVVYKYFSELNNEHFIASQKCIHWSYMFEVQNVISWIEVNKYTYIQISLWENTLVEILLFVYKEHSCHHQSPFVRALYTSCQFSRGSWL